MTFRQHLLTCAVVFSAAYLFLFLGMSRQPNIYDEGLVLTAAMRVAAGQVPHRDFYANYGPAQFYLLAGLFKAFGVSLLVERLYDLLIKALIAVAIYRVLRSCCRQTVALVTAAVAVLWIFSVNGLAGTPVVPVGLLNLIAVALILPAFSGDVSRIRVVAAGGAAGLSTLLRYDTGVALLGLEVLLLAISAATWPATGKVRRFCSRPWPCLLAFVAVTVPFVIAYLAVAPLHDFVFDILLYPAKFYRRGRSLPMPHLWLNHLENLEIYLLVVVGVFALYASRVLRSGASGAPLTPADAQQDGRRRGLLIAFGLLVLVMYLKGLVRMELQQMYLALLPSLIVTAILFENRLVLPRPASRAVMVLVGLSAVAVTWATLNEMRRLQVYHFSVAEYGLQSILGKSPAIEQDWCQRPSPLTRGFCFLATRERMQAIEFIAAHTTPDQRLFSGLGEHDRIFVNDNLLYFATGRLPATRWSHFDPGLQNSFDIQKEMIGELERSVPPYVVLDSEFSNVREPNDSALSSGVELLDDYLEQRYRPVVSFGDIAIRQRVR